MKPFFTRAIGRDAEEGFNGAKPQGRASIRRRRPNHPRKTTLIMVETRGVRPVLYAQHLLRARQCASCVNH